MTSQFAECAKVPSCTLGKDGAPKVFVTLGRIQRCRSTVHAWHDRPMDWIVPPDKLCPDHACEALRAAGEPREPTQPQQLGDGSSGESAEQAALRLRFDQQERA